MKLFRKMPWSPALKAQCEDCKLWFKKEGIFEPTRKCINCFQQYARKIAKEIEGKKDEGTATSNAADKVAGETRRDESPTTTVSKEMS